MTTAISNAQIKTVLNWSSGKDAALAYHFLKQEQKHKVTKLLTSINEEYNRIFMHGIREKLLDLQAERMRLPLIKVKLPSHPDDSLYQQAMLKSLNQLKSEGITTAAFGDIFLDDLKQYREQQLALAGFLGVFPLWKKDTRELIQSIEETGIDAIVVCVNGNFLDPSFLGRKIDRTFLNLLPANVDPCGENGEFHTFVFNAPFFSSPIPIITGETVHKTYASPNDKIIEKYGFYFLDIDVD